MTGIDEMFAEYSTADPYEEAFWFERQYEARLESQRIFGRFYAKTVRGKECARGRKQRWIAKDPAHARQVRLEAQRRWRAKNIDKLRAQDRARKRAA